MTMKINQTTVYHVDDLDDLVLFFEEKAMRCKMFYTAPSTDGAHLREQEREIIKEECWKEIALVLRNTVLK